ncbi:hypothetical protein BGZ63DRAFT_396558 [Mariannaea sp. PMI_226]|nr:hypothetical protein BGZ63DRAFT_396558 [Mariannaea sp. PMI_226]
MVLGCMARRKLAARIVSHLSLLLQLFCFHDALCHHVPPGDLELAQIELAIRTGPRSSQLIPVRTALGMEKVNRARHSLPNWVSTLVSRGRKYHAQQLILACISPANHVSRVTQLALHRREEASVIFGLVTTWSINAASSIVLEILQLVVV